MSTPDIERMRMFVADLLSDRDCITAPPIGLVKANHLGPLAYRRGVAEFRDEYAAAAIMAERRAQILRDVLRAFADRGIEAAMLKGVSFLGNIYPDVAERPMNDIDLLVRVTQLPDAIEALKALGFQRTGFERKLSDYYHAIVFNRDDMMVELHRNIMQRLRMRMPLDDVWARTRPDDQGSGARRLERVDELLMCMIHISRHELAVPAINFVDVRRLWQRLDETQRIELRDRARDYRVGRAIDAVLGMTELLAAGSAGTPRVGAGSAILPSTDDVLRGNRPRRARQIAQKLYLTQGPREHVGLAFTTVAAIVNGWYLSRRGTRRGPG